LIKKRFACFSAVDSAGRECLNPGREPNLFNNHYRYHEVDDMSDMAFEVTVNASSAEAIDRVVVATRGS